MTPPSTTVTFRVRYVETDLMGGYYHGRALDWFEMGRTELSRSLGMPYSEWEKRGVFIPVIEVAIKYKSRATYDDLLQMTVSAETLGRTRLKFTHTILHADSGRLVCEGSTVHALIDARGFPQRIPEWVLALIEGDRTGSP